eukprot:15793_1
MAESSKKIESADKELLSLLQIDNKGWDINLFEETAKLSTCICEFCGSICREAVELGCEHEEDEICLYCDQCLKELIGNNNDKCILDNHDNPLIIAARSARRQIFRSMVLCPFSSEYKQRCKAKDNVHLIDTRGNCNDDEKEGNQVFAAAPRNNHDGSTGCQWSGTLKQLVNDHIIGCAKINNPTYTLKIKIRTLQDENKSLKQQITSLKLQHVENENKLEQEIASLGEIINIKDKIINEVTEFRDEYKRKDQIIVQLQDKIKELQQQLNKQFQLMQNMQESKRNDNDNDTENDKQINNGLEFNITDDCKSFLTTMGKHTLSFAGKYGKWCWCKYGSLLSGTDNLTVYFEVEGVGESDNYGFGFVTPQQKAYCCTWQYYACQIHGNNVLYEGHSSEKILKNINKIIQKNKKNIVVVSANMSMRKGWIWNDANRDDKAEFDLPEQVWIEVMMGKSDKKYIAVSRVISK